MLTTAIYGIVGLIIWFSLGCGVMHLAKYFDKKVIEKRRLEREAKKINSTMYWELHKTKKKLAQALRRLDRAKDKSAARQQ